MLIYDTRLIGDRLLALRKRRGLTQMELADAAGIADRTYADIERGSKKMRVDTALHICQALNVTPDEIFTQEDNTELCRARSELFARLDNCSAKEQRTALKILAAYIDSL